MYIAHNLFYFLPLFSLSYYSHFFFLFLRYVQTIRSEVDEFLFSISSCGKSTVALRAHFLLYSWRFTGLASWQCGMMIHQLHMPRLPEKFNDLKFLMCFLSFLAQKAVDWQIQLGYRPCARYLFFFAAGYEPVVSARTATSCWKVADYRQSDHFLEKNLVSANEDGRRTSTTRRQHTYFRPCPLVLKLFSKLEYQHA